MRESVLQEWAVRQAKARQLGNSIENIDELKQRLAEVQATSAHANVVEKFGLERALRVSDILSTNIFLLDDENISGTDACMRPDLVLLSPGGSYVLIELKARPAAEKTTVQQLLAYRQAIRMQRPHLNDFVFVVIAGQWTASLREGVRSLIFEGNSVLPLQWHEEPSADNGDAQFKLRARTDLFRFDVVQSYLPFDAMRAYTVSVHDRGHDVGSMSVIVREYFYHLARQVANDCAHRLQTGFALRWSNLTGVDQLVALTLVTVDQNWRYGANTSVGAIFEAPPKRGIEAHLYTSSSDALLAGQSHILGLLADPAVGERWNAMQEYYPTSTLSVDIVERHRNRVQESGISRRRWSSGGFYSEVRVDFRAFLDDMRREGDTFQFIEFLPFGELAEFTGQREVADEQAFFDVLVEFNEHKEQEFFSGSFSE
jgi:hypothetical protein